ncbi:MAG: hypothetical protein JOY73_09430 [Actinobacteria bacterium]|nr:hypothetical protein [Actinomycetota bacterium]
MLWDSIKRLWSRNNDRLAERELDREIADKGLHVNPNAGGGLYDEPFQPTEPRPADDLPDKA